MAIYIEVQCHLRYRSNVLYKMERKLLRTAIIKTCSKPTRWLYQNGEMVLADEL